MLKACISTFNDASTILFTLRSIQNWVDDILVVDGPYKEYSNEMCSTDGTLDIAENFGAKVIAMGRWHNQVEKRNYYMKALNSNDYALVIDSDEILFNQKYLDFLTYDELAYNCSVMSEPRGSIYQDKLIGNGYCFKIWPKPRIYHSSLRYQGKHWAVIDRNNNDIVRQRYELPHSGTLIVHINYLRSGLRINQKFAYYQNKQREPFGLVGKPFFPYGDCTKICYDLEMPNVCVNYKDGYCIAHKKMIRNGQTAKMEKQCRKTKGIQA